MLLDWLHNCSNQKVAKSFFLENAKPRSCYQPHKHENTFSWLITVMKDNKGEPVYTAAWFIGRKGVVDIIRFSLHQDLGFKELILSNWTKLLFKDYNRPNSSMTILLFF